MGSITPVHCEHGCYEGSNEIGVGVEHSLYRNMRRVCKHILHLI